MEVWRQNMSIYDPFRPYQDNSLALSTDTYDWTFRYELSRLVYCKESIDNSDIKFEREGDNLKGFNIIINNV